MGNVVHRDTLAFMRSVNDPDYPDPPYLSVPPSSNNETLLRTVPTKYLTLTGDVLAEMTQAEKDAVDAADEAARITAMRSDAESALGQNRDARSLSMRVLAWVVLDEVNELRTAMGLQPRTRQQMITSYVGKLRAGQGEA